MNKKFRFTNVFDVISDISCRCMNINVTNIFNAKVIIYEIIVFLSNLTTSI